MSDDMKLIMENWRPYRSNILSENDQGPETVGELLTVIEAHTKALSDPVKKAFLLLAQVLSDVAGFVDATDTQSDAVTDMAEYVTTILQTALEDGVVSKAFLNVATNIPFGAITEFLKQPAVVKYLVSKIGAKALKEVVDTLVPMAKLATGAIKGAWALFKAVKKGKEIFASAKSPESAFAAIMQDVMTAPDNKATTTGFLKKFNVDDEWQKILDDKIEIKYIDYSIKFLKGIDPNTRMDAVDFNARLVDWLKDNFKDRTVSAPGAAA